MTVITHARRKSRLSQIIDTAGGVSVRTALQQARANLAGLEPRAMVEIADRIAELEAVSPPAPSEDATPALAAAYRAASGVIDAAAPFELKDLCASAARLCDLIDAATPERPLDWRVLPIGARTLRLLLALPTDATDDRARVRGELDRMIELKLGQA